MECPCSGASDCFDGERSICAGLVSLLSINAGRVGCGMVRFCLKTGSDHSMKTRKKIAVGTIVVLVLLTTTLAVMARRQAHRLITNPQNTRRVPTQTPADTGLPFSEVLITNREGLKLVAWYVPSSNTAAVIAQHGFRNCRQEMLPAATALFRHGYGVLISSVRAHDRCDGEQITFGVREVEDLETWYDYLRARSDVDTNRLGILGNSMGGSLVIQFAARHPDIKAIAADSAFSSLDDTVATSLKHYTGLPAFPFAPMVSFWAKVETGCDLSQVNAKVWIHQLSPRPVFLMQGGADTTVSRSSGELLYAAAGEPKELWYDPAAGHAKFATNKPAYEQRLTAFFDKYLLATNRLPKQPSVERSR